MLASRGLERRGLYEEGKRPGLRKPTSDAVSWRARDGASADSREAAGFWSRREGGCLLAGEGGGRRGGGGEKGAERQDAVLVRRHSTGEASD